VSECSGVDDYAVSPTGLLLDEVDEIAFAVGLNDGHLCVDFGGLLFDKLIDLIQGLLAVYHLVSFAEYVQVGPMYHKYSHFLFSEEGFLFLLNPFRLYLPLKGCLTVRQVRRTWPAPWSFGTSGSRCRP